MPRTSTTFPKRPDAPAGGEGWGGPAKGGEARGASRLVPGGRTRETIAARQARIDALTENLEDMAFNATTEQVRVNATVAALDRLAGKPVQTNINRNTNELSSLSDDELDAELARREGTPPGPVEGAGSAPDTAEPDDLVH